LLIASASRCNLPTMKHLILAFTITDPESNLVAIIGHTRAR